MLLWIIAMIVFLGVEAATAGLVSIWFAGGSCAALIAAALGAPFWLQFVIFLGVSGLVMVSIRPFAKNFLNVKRKPTNADRVIGVICPVTEDIDNIAETGAVVVGGKEWTARSLTGVNFAKGDYVRVNSIQGVKLIVEPAVETARAD